MMSKMFKILMVSLLITSCGTTVRVKGGTTNKVEGGTTNEVKFTIDMSNCDEVSEERREECIFKYLEVLQMILDARQEAKDAAADNSL